MGLQVFGNGPLYLIAADRHRGDPHPGRQHRLRRLPAALVDHRPGRVPAPPARQPGRPARVLQRRARARRRGGAADHRVRRRHDRADPALRGRRVHVVHALAVRHGPSPPEGRASRARSAAMVVSGFGSFVTVRRARDRGDHEVHRRRLGAARRDPADHPAVQVDPPALQDGRRGPGGHPRLQGPEDEPHGRRARGLGPQGRARGARLRQVAAPEPAGRALGRLRRGGAGEDRGGLGAVRDGHPARDPLLPVPGARPAGAALRRRARRPAGQRHRDRS